MQRSIRDVGKDSIVDYREFNQAWYLAMFPKEQHQAVGFSFAVYFLVLLHHKKDFFRYAETNIRKKDGRLVRFIDRCQDFQSYMNPQQVDKAKLSTRIELMQSLFGIGKYQDRYYFQGYNASSYSGLAKYLAAKSDMYYLMLLPSHTMTAYCDKDGKVTFFDPNSGAISATDRKKLAKFFDRYLGYRDRKGIVHGNMKNSSYSYLSLCDEYLAEEHKKPESAIQSRRKVPNPTKRVFVEVFRFQKRLW